MARIYKYNGEYISDEFVMEGFEESGMATLEEYISSTEGLEFEDDEPQDFPTSTVEDADAVQQPMTASQAGFTESPSVDIPSDLEDPLSEYYVTIEDLKKSEEDASPALNKKLAGIGISTKQGTSFGSLDALNFENSIDPKQTGEGVGTSFVSDLIGEPTKIFSAVGIGSNKTDEELAAAAAEINKYIKLKGDTSFLNKAKKRSGDAYEKYEESLKAPELTLEELESSMKKDLVSKFSKIQRSELSNITQGLKNEIVGVKQTAATVDQFKNKKEFQAYNQWKKDGYISDFSEDEIRLYDDERKQKYALDASLRYASDLSVEDRMDVLALAASDEKKLNNFSDISDNYLKTEESLKAAIKEFELNPTRDNYTVATTIEQDYLQKQGEMQSLQSKLKKDGSFDKVKTVPLALMDFNKDYNRLRQLRSSFKSTAAGITYEAATLAALAGQMNNPSGIATILASSGSTGVKIEDATGLVSLGDDFQKETENFQRAIAVDEINNISDAGKWVAGSAVNLVPSLAMALTGPAAMPLFFLSGGGSKGMDLAVSRKKASERMLKNKKYLVENPNADTFTLMALNKEMDEDAKILDIKEWQSLSIQALYGIAEVAMEKVGTMTLLKNLKNGTKMLSPTTIKEGFKYVGKGLKEVGKGMRVEGGSEFGTTVLQNFGDIFILGEDKNLFEGGLESFSQGALMGGGMNSINVAKGLRQGYVSVLANKEESRKLSESLNALRKITKQPNIQSWLDLKNLNLKLPKETQSVVDALVKDMQSLEEGVLFKLGSTLSIDQAYKVEETNRKMRLINNKLIAASNNPGIKAFELTQIEAQLRTQFDILAKEREQLLSDDIDIKQTKENYVNTNVSLDSSLGYAYYTQSMLNESVKSIANNYNNLSPEANQLGLDDAKKALIKEGNKNPSLKEIKTKAINSYIDSVYKKKIEKGRTNAEAFAKQQGLDLEIMSFEGKDANAQIIKAFEDAGVTGKELTEIKELVKNGSFEGGEVAGTNKIIINMNAAIKNKRIGIFAHEVLHKYAKEKYGSNKKAIDKAGEDLLSYLEKNDKDIFAKVKFRIDTSYTEKDSDGNVIKDENYFEEAMNAMSDVLSDGQILNEASMNKIRVFANSFLSGLPSKFQFKANQGRDAYEFVKGYNKAAHFGGVVTPINPIVKSTDEPEKDSDGSLVKKSTSKQSTLLQEQLDNLDEFDFDNEVDFQTAKTNLETKIRLAKKKELSKPTEEAKPKDKTKDDTKKNEKRIGDQLKAMVPPGTTNKDFKEKVAIKVIDSIDNGMLNPLIKKIAAGYGVVADNVYGKSWDDFFIEVAGVQLKKNIMSFNPESNNDLGGYIIGSQYGVRNRVKEALAKFKKEGEGGFKEDVSVAKNVIAREDTAPQEAEKRKYTPLTKSNVVPNFTITAITDKLTKVLASLESKITAKRGDNAATTPLIAEIKKKIGKVVGDPEAAPKLVIQRLGKLKDGTYEKNLIKHKKAIIENMTTTFLMGKDSGKKVSGGIPQAIEKSVGGKFTGKKVTVNVGGKEIVQEEFIPNFVPYPEWVGQKIDREKTLVRGATAGNEIVRRVPADKVSDADFVGLFIDEKGKLIRGKREALGKALAEEMAFEILSKEIQNENSEISKAFEGNQEAQGEVLSDNFVNELTRDIDRGTVKFSLSTGDAKLDKARTNLGKYITSKYKFPNGLSNEQFYTLVKRDAPLKELFDTLKKEYKRYLGRIKTDRMTELAVKFNASGNDNFNVFLNNYFDNKFSNISSALGVDPNSISRFKIKEETARKTKSFLQDYILDLINKDPKNAAKTFITTLQSALASGTKQSLFGTNENLYKFIKSIKDDKVEKAFKNVKLVKSASGLTFQIGKEKVTTKFKQETSASDFNSLINDYINNVEVDKRNEYADKAANAFLNFIDYLKDNKIDPEITGLLLNSLGGSMRSSAKTLAKIKGAFIVEGLTAKDYTFEHGIPTNQLLVASALYIYNKNNNINKSFIKNIIDKSSIYIIPTKISDAIDSFYRNTFSNDKALSETNPEFYRYFSKNKYFQNYLKDKGISQFEESNITNLLDPKAAVKRNIKFSKSLAAFDPKGKVYKPSDKFSKTMNSTFNKMLERKTGIAADETISKTIANRRGQKKGKYKIFMPSSLDDFKGLTSYTFAGKGKQGEADQKFFQDTLIDPYFKGIRAIEETRQAFKDDFRALNKQMKPVIKKLGKLVPGTEFTHDQAIRVALWNASGYEIPGISEIEQKKLVDYINNDAELSEYARKLQQISKRPKWAKPGDFWDAETILSDLNNLTEKVGRKEFLSEFIENADIIFSEDNLNKVQAGYGKATRDALVDILYRMKNGTNRPSSTTDNTNKWNTWINNSIGAIMFFNRRSALLQTLSTVNFINWSDNNPLKAAAAFANQKQYWSDFATLFNSPKLKQRRSGLKSDVNEAEIARAVKGSKNKATAALSYLLKIGFTPTQMADSFAIAAGGATFYRNRIKSYLKKVNEEGEALYTKEQAEEMAFKDFSQISEETQQSGDPALISSDQASTAGRLLLAFQNTPIQLNRSIKKAALDIKNRRRTPGQTMLQSDFSNFSKIIYYGTIQNIIFSALQNALFALIPGFEEEDDELTEEEQLEKYGKVYSTKQSRIINGMIDTTLKGGFGLPGAGISMIKNVALEWDKQEEKEFMADHAYTILAFFNIIPSLGSKGRKIYSAIQTKRFEKDVIEKRKWDVTIDGKFNLSPSYKVLGAVTEGFTNLPLDRAVTELNALTEALDYRNTVWQRVALALGWRSWDVGAENEEHELIKTEAKARRKEEGKKKAKATRAKNKKIKEAEELRKRNERLKRLSK